MCQLLTWTQTWIWQPTGLGQCGALMFQDNTFVQWTRAWLGQKLGCGHLAIHNQQNSPRICCKWGTAGGLAASRVYTILNCADWVSDGEPTGKNFKWRCVCWFNKTIWQRIKFHKRFVLCFGIIVYTKAMTIILHTNIQIWHKKPVSSFRAVHRLKAKTFSFVEPQSVWCFVF